AGGMYGTPGKTTLTSQLPVIPPNRDADRPARDDATGAASATGAPASPGVAQQKPSPSEEVPQPATQDHAGAGGAWDRPSVAQYVIPFDRNPKSVAGEQIIFAATYTHATPDNFKLVYTSAGGHFNAQGSGVTSKTFSGLKASNVDWFIDAAWNGKT